MQKEKPKKRCQLEYWNKTKKGMVKCGEVATWKYGHKYLCQECFEFGHVDKTVWEEVKQ